MNTEAAEVEEIIELEEDEMRKKSEPVTRMKLHLASGRKVYVYGDPLVPRPGLTAEDLVGVVLEQAGYYEPITNVVHMTEPTSMEEGLRTVEKMPTPKVAT